MSETLWLIYIYKTVRVDDCFCSMFLAYLICRDICIDSIVSVVDNRSRRCNEKSKEKIKKRNEITIQHHTTGGRFTYMYRKKKLTGYQELPKNVYEN